MKISDIMQPIIATATEKTSLKEVGKVIFSLRISAMPIVRRSRLVGMVTRKDILSKIFPSMEELTEDYIHLRDFDKMEKRLREVLDIPASKIMSRRVTTVSKDTSIMNVQAIMLINDFSHLPVVDKNKKLLGMITQGDIFKKLIKEEVSVKARKNKTKKARHS